MKNKLIRELEEVMPFGMGIPAPIKQLYEWIEGQHLFVETSDGKRIGFLYPEKDLKESWTDSGRRGGTNIEFAASGNVNLKYWFGVDSEETNQRLCVFAQSGAEGSECAFWRNEDDEIKIVHLGSGSGSTLTCVLAENAVDFLRLLAIGYDEICWDEAFPFPPNTIDKEFIVEPNVEFQEWVRNTFSVEIPMNALEIVKRPTSMDDDQSDDEFFQWSQKYIE